MAKKKLDSPDWIPPVVVFVVILLGFGALYIYNSGRLYADRMHLINQCNSAPEGIPIEDAGGNIRCIPTFNQMQGIIDYLNKKEAKEAEIRFSYGSTQVK